MEFKEQLKDKVYMTKLVIGAIVMLGVSKIISDIIENNTDPDSTLDRAKIRVGSLVLGFMVADAAARYTDRGIDFVIEMWRETKIELKEASSSEK